MTIITSSRTPSKVKLDALIILVPEFEPSKRPWSRLERSLEELCLQGDPLGRFSGKEGSVHSMPTLGKIAAKWLVWVGLGKTGEPLAHQRALGKAIRQLDPENFQQIGIVDTHHILSSETIVHAIEEGCYYFRSFRADPEKRVVRPQSFEILGTQGKSDDWDRAEKVAKAVRYARDIANQPPNLFSPAVLAKEAQVLARRRKLSCEVWDAAKLKKDGFGGILAVGQGSANPPHFIRLDYRGAAAGVPPYVIVGKAITFDTGGISIKPSDKMDEMKFDKCGGIAVLGILDAVAALRLPINVIGLISSAENMPSSKSYRPGDLVKSLSGKYIEVLNTDAEGRIVLADALTYAKGLKPQAVVDLATLTGACIICFGHESAAFWGIIKPSSIN